MIVGIHQPDYIPYLGYFYKIAQSDLFVFLDDAQFSNNNMHHWNRIKTPQGECRLKIPLEYHFGDQINQVRTKDNLNWKEKHLKMIRMNYAKAKYFRKIYEQFETIFMKEYPSLALQNIALNTFIMEQLNIKTKTCCSSSMDITCKREERVIEICQKLHGTIYYSGHGAKSYQKESHFLDKGIQLKYSDYVPIPYPQLWGEFLPNMSVLDFLFQCVGDLEEQTLIEYLQGKVDPVQVH